MLLSEVVIVVGLTDSVENSLATAALVIREADEGEKLAKPVSGGGDAPEEVLVLARRSRALGEAKPQKGAIGTIATFLRHSTSFA